MNTVEFFEDPRLTLPITPKSADTRNELVARFKDYDGALAAVDRSTNLGSLIADVRPAAGALAGALIEAIDLAFAGRRSRAVSRLARALEASKAHFDVLRQDPGAHWKDALARLYRVRVFQVGEYPRAREDLFHIPFQSRALVRPFRYSIEGHPCLYVGRTLYTCWEELGRPSFHGAYFSVLQLELAADQRLLDLGLRPGAIAHVAYGIERGDPRWKGRESLAVAHAACWPLLASCSVAAWDRKAPFIPEYLVPQMILDYVREDDKLVGVCYASTRGVAADHFPYLAWNFVFPARTPGTHGHCDQLLKMFRMSEPVSELTMPALAQAAVDAQEHFAAKIELQRGLPQRYLDTYFGRLESDCHYLPRAALV